jgi:hypothetical protein
VQAARALVRVLADSGVDHIFGLPGDTGMSLYDALNDARDEITHVMTRDERSASFMATLTLVSLASSASAKGRAEAGHFTSYRVLPRRKAPPSRCYASLRIPRSGSRVEGC